ncbi:MAG: 4-hydroxy-3-methylbut-2-enyl diphosphate reductase [Nitrospinota bacterium]
MKNVILAKTAGFCWGVKRAIDIAMEVAYSSNKKIYTYGPLIHNPQVIAKLENSNIFELTESDNLKDNSTVIIRTHGVTPEVRTNLEANNCNLTDATCPLVAKVQRVIKKYANRGFSTIIVGDKGHAEVIGLIGFTNSRGIVINSINDIDQLPKLDSVNVVAQTTCDQKLYERLIIRLKERFTNIVIHNTICDATIERQSEVIELADKVDLMVVVGGRNSANTKRLADISEAAGTKTLLVETEDDINTEELICPNIIGVTAGASTPSWLISGVVDKIKRCRLENQHEALND